MSKNAVTDSAKLFEELQAGDSIAENELFDQYVQRLIALIQKRISGKVGRRLDAEEIAVDALKSVIVGAQMGRYEWRRSGDIWRMLTSIAVNKFLEQQRAQHQIKRSVAKEESVNGVPVHVLTNEPSPDVVTKLSEQLDLALSELAGKPRLIVEMFLQGVDDEKIAEETSRSVATVRRIVTDFRRNLERQFRTASSG